VVSDSDQLLAFDVGGANIKAADGLGWTSSEPFELWRQPQRLSAALARTAAMRRPRRIVATMTGEIADCFHSRAEGVAGIVAAIEAAAESLDPPASVGIYLVDGSIVSSAEAISRPLDAAASNWHAMARLAGRHAASDRALVIDVGSTTTDILPLFDRQVAAVACDDIGRMASGELVYTGVERTPVAATVRSLPFRGGSGRSLRPIASERYADSRDVWLLLGGLPENPASTETADGQPFTREASRIRLARMLLADPGDFSAADADSAARWCASLQARQVARSIASVVRAIGWRPTSIVESGHGACLARMALERLGWNLPVVSLPDLIGPGPSRAAPAHALALIARGEIP